MIAYKKTGCVFQMPFDETRLIHHTPMLVEDIMFPSSQIVPALVSSNETEALL